MLKWSNGQYRQYNLKDTYSKNKVKFGQERPEVWRGEVLLDIVDFCWKRMQCIYKEKPESNIIMFHFELPTLLRNLNYDTV